MKYEITAKEGDRRFFRPRLQGREWSEHPMYGMPCTVVQSGAVYDVHLIRFDGMGEDATWWANGCELKRS